jgi:vancomycin resistance protein YoaR
MTHAGGAGARWSTRASAWLVLCVSALALAWGAARAAPSAARRFNHAPDATLEARPLPVDERLDSWLGVRARELASRRAFLEVGSEQVETTFAELGLALDVDATRELVRRLPRPTGAWNQLKRALGGPPREVPRLTPVVRFDAERARAFLATLRTLNREPEDARLDLVQHERVEAVPGRELLLAETLEHVATGPRGEDARFALVFRELPAKLTLAMLPAVDVSQVLGRYETDFRGHAGARAVNIRRAARYLDRVVIEPGATFSFNRTVGPRSEARGFVKAPVIVHDETEPGLGGGVCQVATTLHAAAVFAGLQVLERRSHSRPSGYAPLGLDATVIEDKVDFRFRNPFDTAVMLHTGFPRSTSIRVEILGHEPLGKVEHAARVVERYPFLRRIVEKPELAAGSFEKKQKGGYGYDIVSVVSLTRADGSVATRRYPSKYYPVPEVLWIGKGTDASTLPPLPDGATGLEQPE